MISHAPGRVKSPSPTATTWPRGGGVLIPLPSLVEVVYRWGNGELSPSDVRVWLACRELQHRRRGHAVHRYRFEELSQLTRLRLDRAASSVATLASWGLVDWQPDTLRFPASSNGPPGLVDAVRAVAGRGDPGRLVCVPRRLLRWLARRRRQGGLVASALLLIARCWWPRRMAKRGLAQAWIAGACGIGERTYSRAKAALVRAGWLWRDRHIPRLGRYFCLLTRQMSMRKKQRPSRYAPGTETRDGVRKANKDCSKKARPPPKPVRDGPPLLRDIRTRDLRADDAMLELFQQELRAGRNPHWIDRAERQREWFGLAEHALRVGRDPGALFAHLITKGPRYMTSRDEDAGSDRYERTQRKVRARSSRAGITGMDIMELVGLGEKDGAAVEPRGGAGGAGLGAVSG